MWFQGSYVDFDGLVVPGSPPRECARIRLAPDWLSLEVDDVRVSLGWDDYSKDWLLGSFVDAPGSSLQPLSQRRGHYPAVGVAVYASEASVQRIMPVAVALAHKRFPLGDPTRHALNRGPVVPLHNSELSAPWRHSYGAMVAVLCELLQSRPDLRPKLADQSLCERIRDEMLHNPMKAITPGIAMRNRAIEIHNAMSSVGLTHKLGGRPLPDETLIDQHAAVEKVMQRLSVGRLTRDLDFSDKEVRRVLKADFYSVKPWPFKALIT